MNVVTLAVDNVAMDIGKSAVVQAQLKFPSILKIFLSGFKPTMKRAAVRTLGIIAVIGEFLGIGVVSVSANGPPPPHLLVKITTHSPSVSGDGFDATLYVIVRPRSPRVRTAPTGTT